MARPVRLGVFLALVVCAWPAVAVRAARDLNADAYLDKLRGMWFGQVMGNYAGRGTFDDGGVTRNREGAVRRGGWDYDIGWESFMGTDPWGGDDDTALEYLYLNTLTTNPSPTNADLDQAWADHVIPEQFYIANRQAGWLIQRGAIPPDCGSIRSNMHWYAIDSQIATESIGAAAPGMRQRAAELVGRFASVTNDGYPVHAAQFYGAMYAAAAFESDVEQVVAAGLDVVPQTSRTRQVVQDVIDWYQLDAADGVLDWRATQEKLFDEYGWNSDSSYHRYRGWIESTTNCGATVLAMLYGQGYFKDTVEIGILAGWDVDCNAATAGGLIGLIGGYSALPAELTGAASDNYRVESGLKNMNLSTTITQIAAAWRDVAEQQILAAGGSISGQGPARTYHLPQADPVAPPPDRPDPPGPGGLVGRVLQAGGHVTPSASIENHLPHDDRMNLEAIMDGLSDVGYDGHLPYWTNDGDNDQPQGGDYYQLDFDRDVTFVSVTFFEGDILWNGINNDPTFDEPKGGYFVNLTVEVGRDGLFDEVANLKLSEALDPFKYFQRIVLSFEPIVGDAVRIRGDAGGRYEFTSIVELEARGFLDGLVAGDANCDGLIDVQDLTILATHWFDTGMVNWIDGDFVIDGTIDVQDLTALAGSWGAVGARSVPEPACAAVVLLSGWGLGRRRR